MYNNWFSVWWFYCQSVEQLDNNILSSFTKRCAPCWRFTLLASLVFIRAYTLLKPRFIRKRDAECADLYLLQYCKKFQDLYGPKAITPNMHLHTHLKQCILDYGPLHAFWCYPFEWYNRILGSFHSNKKSIKSQWKRFVFCKFVCTLVISLLILLNSFPLINKSLMLLEGAKMQISLNLFMPNHLN